MAWSRTAQPRELGPRYAYRYLWQIPRRAPGRGAPRGSGSTPRAGPPEITTIPGVVEDVTDIILNVKSLVVKNTSDETRTIRINRHEKGVVTASMIEPGRP